MKTTRGFSLLEIMVAMGILGFVVSVVLGAQSGVVAANKSAANIGSAVHLGRCKMTEVEEELIRKGYPEMDETNRNGEPCCAPPFGTNLEPTGSTTYLCDVKIEKVVLPDPPSSSGGDAGASSGSASPLSSGSPLTQLMSGQGLPGMDAGLSGISSAISPETAGQGTAGLLSFVLGMVYPSLKVLMESSIRRLTITVKWTEGKREKDFTLVQFVTNPQRGGFQSGVVGLDVDPAGATGGTGGGTAGAAGAARSTTVNPVSGTAGAR